MAQIVKYMVIKLLITKAKKVSKKGNKYNNDNAAFILVCNVNISQTSHLHEHFRHIFFSD